MSYYFYRYIDTHGKTESKLGHFQSIEFLFSELEKSKEILVNYYKIPNFLNSIINSSAKKPRITDQIELCDHLSTYLSSGIDIQSSIADLKKSVSNPTFSAYLTVLMKHLNSGYLLSQALEAIPGTDDVLVNMAKIGEESGTLEKTIKDAAGYLRFNLEIKKNIKRALIYPSFIVSILGSGILFWLIYVVPQIVDLFHSLNVDIPLGLKIVIFLSEFSSKYILWFLLFPVLILFVILLYKKNSSTKSKIDKWLWNTPVVKLILQPSQKAFCFQYIGLLYNSGITITNALKKVSETSTSYFFKEKLEEIGRTIYQGQSLAYSMTHAGIFEPIVERMIHIGEQTGSLGNYLPKIALIYQDNLSEFISNISKTIEPVLMMIVAVIFAFFAVTLIAPLYDLLSSIGAV
ncbi:MAG: type II secretion system F family protein [Gammaproteobacteria bacterium]|nr:type II secretion system F family protein [Gammaproteobacteria bacterium]